MPNEKDIEILGPQIYEQFVYQYNNLAKTTDQKWEMIDWLNGVRYGNSGSKLREAVSFIMGNPQYVLGAVGATAIYIGVTIATGGTAGIAAAPLIFAGNVLTVGGISGAVTGITYNEYTRADIRKQLQQQYGINPDTIKLYNMDKMPEQAVKLCEEYDDLDRRNQSYVDATTKLAELAMMLYLSDIVYRTAGATVGALMANKGNLGSVAQTAKNWQLENGGYGRADDWREVKLKKGDIVWRGEPGQSNFYTTNEVADMVGTDATKLYEGLQVGKGAFPTYREGFTMYEVQSDITVAYSKALANNQISKGGGLINILFQIIKRL